MFKNQHSLDLKENRFSPIRDFIGLTLEPHPYTPCRLRPFLSLPVWPWEGAWIKCKHGTEQGQSWGWRKGNRCYPMPTTCWSVCVPQLFPCFLLQFWAQPYRGIASHFGGDGRLFSPFLIWTIRSPTIAASKVPALHWKVELYPLPQIRGPFPISGWLSFTSMVK